jgi:glycosyltransferase involved in cell wall biosynthesis
LAVSVLNVITGLGVGGAEATLVRLATAAQARGMPQHVVSLGSRGHYADELEKGGIEVSTLGITSLGKAPWALARLTGILNSWSPSVVHGWMYHGNVMAALAHRVARGSSSRKLLWNLRASNMDEERYGSIQRWGARLSAWPDLIIANSESGAAFHKARGYRPRRMSVIYNGIDTARFRPSADIRAAQREQLGIPADSPVAIHVARVDPMKDHQTFLQAMAALPNVRGILVGARTEQLAIPANVTALGFRSDTPSLYPLADIVVSSSAFGEGFSNAIAEGMSAGLVPVATDVGDASHIVGDVGRLVPAQGAAAMAEAIGQISQLSPAERACQGQRARERIIENFALDRAVDAFSSLYQTLCLADSGSHIGSAVGDRDQVTGE